MPGFKSLRLKPPTPQENKFKVWGLVDWVCGSGLGGGVGGLSGSWGWGVGGGQGLGGVGGVGEGGGVGGGNP